MQGVANAAYLSRNRFCGLLYVAPYCVPGGVRVVSKGCRLRLAGSFAFDGHVRKEEGLGTSSHASYPRISSSCLSCAFGGIIANARSRIQHSTGFSTWPTIPIRRDLRTTIAARSERSPS